LTKEIALNRGKVAIVDDEDYEELSEYSWCFDGRYASSKTVVPGKKVYLHRYLMGSPENKLVDHVNGDKLDNRTSNLRIADYRQNSANSKTHSHNTSGYRGVYKWRNYWRAAITYDGKQISCGYYSDKDEAAKAYNRYAAIFFGEFARLNEINGISYSVERHG
jgi:hypothetical protein